MAGPETATSPEERARAAATADIARLAQRAAALQLDQIPPATRKHAAVVLADTVGVIMGGSLQEEIAQLCAGDALLEPPRDGPSQILRPDLPRADPQRAAFVNATAGTFLELDEGYRPTGHPAIHVIPAALAAAQALHRSGAALLAAIVSGYEVAARLFEAYRLTYPVHPHGHLGAVGAAVAVASLRGVGADEPARIASTLPLLTVWEPCFEGATVRNAFAGVASAVGVLANRLAAAGFKGSREAQAVTFGQLAGSLQSPSVLSEPVTIGDLRIQRDYLKLHSACALSHTALDAVLALEVDVAEVESVLVETVANNLKLDRQAQANALSTRFSLPYAVAAAIIHGHTRPAAFAPDERVQALARRVTVRGAPDLESQWPSSSPARVTVRLRGGGSRCQRADNPRGHHANPASDEELRQKFATLSWARDPDALRSRLLAVEGELDCAAIFNGL